MADLSCRSRMQNARIWRGTYGQRQTMITAQ
jgi:hypothetical protein